MATGGKCLLMLVVMAIEAQQFPIASVGRVVVVIVIAVMNGEFPEALAG